MVSSITVFCEKPNNMCGNELKSQGKTLSRDHLSDDFFFEEELPPRRYEKCVTRHVLLNYLCGFLVVASFVLIGASLLLNLKNPRSWKSSGKNLIENLEEHLNLEKMNRFRNFMEKFNKSYSNTREFNFRFAVFWRNVEELKKYEDDSNAHFSINRFSDQTDEEKKAILMDKEKYGKSDFSGILTEISPKDWNITAVNRPDYVDWRNAGKVMHVKDQQQCGSCWAFATVSSVESQYAIRRGTLWSLSEQELVDCDSDSYGCKGGFLVTALNFVLNNGLETEDDYPYNERTNQCSIRKDKTRVTIDDGYKLQFDEEHLADWVANIGPVTFQMNVPKSMFGYHNGIYSPSSEECNDSQGLHAMSIIGYGVENGLGYWIIKNSWGSAWGDQGYMRLVRGVNVCGLTDVLVAPKIN